VLRRSICPSSTWENELLQFLLEQKRAGKNVVAYGAAAKGNTLLNFAGVKPDLDPLCRRP
jgi:hypothetical protein